MTAEKKLHIGCGHKKLDGFINIDVVPNCDLQLDLDKEPLPFEDGSIDCVFSYHAFEHFSRYLFVLGEVWRVLRHGGRLLIQVPYVTLTEYNLVNPYHKTNFNEFSFDFFDPAKLKGSANEGNGIHFKKVWHRFHYLREFATMAEPERTYARRHYFNVVRAIDFGIYAVKPPFQSLDIPENARVLLRDELDSCLKSQRRVDWAVERALYWKSGGVAFAGGTNATAVRVP